MPLCDQSVMRTFILRTFGFLGNEKPLPHRQQHAHYRSPPMGNSHTFHLSATRITPPNDNGAKVIHVSPFHSQKRQVDSHRNRKHQAGLVSEVHDPTASDRNRNDGPNYRTQVVSNAGTVIQQAHKKLKQCNLLGNNSGVTPIRETSSNAKGNSDLTAAREKVPHKATKIDSSSLPKRRSRARNKRSKNAIQQEASKNNHYVIRLAFSLFSKGKDTISIEDLSCFFSQNTNENYSYEEIRDMVHRACNGYEISFECFQRIVCMEEREKSQRINQVVPHQIDTSPGRRHSYDASAVIQSTISLDEEHGSTHNRRELLESQKLQYGVYNARHSRSFTARSTSVSVKRAHLNLIVNQRRRHQVCKEASPKLLQSPALKRHVSENTRLTCAEERFFELQSAFKIFDMCQYGSIDCIDLSRVMNQLGLQVKQREIRQLFSLVGKKKKSQRQLDFMEFVNLYKECCVNL